ncbi:actin-related protein 2/3 complex subunit 2B [Jatropha curcas]|uniref:actin-related protein 2/3 complex subunit 2B n=1 Tax=Jatropha curcas TaxID=180498 RepID=UPI001893FA0C|nr:actin-related protein 2/3 complex subunit 2B [Jatropha curcas]
MRVLLNFLLPYVKKPCKVAPEAFIKEEDAKGSLESLVEVLHKENQEEGEKVKRVKAKARCRYVTKLVRFPKSEMLKQRCGEVTRKIKRIRFIKIHGFGRFQRRWLTIPKFSSQMRYTKLD